MYIYIYIYIYHHDIASNNFAFICRKYCISELLAEVSLKKGKNSISTYLQTQKSNKEFFETKTRRKLFKLTSDTTKKVDLNITEQVKALSIMY